MHHVVFMVKLVLVFVFVLVVAENIGMVVTELMTVPVVQMMWMCDSGREKVLFAQIMKMPAFKMMGICGNMMVTKHGRVFILWIVNGRMMDAIMWWLWVLRRL